MSDDIRKKALALLTPPFRFECGYIWDAKGEMVADNRVDADVDGDPVLRVRGWGRLKYLPDAEALQDEIGALLAEALTAAWKARQ